MKTNDVLLYGGIAFAAYYLFLKPKTPVTSAATSVPGSVTPVSQPVSTSSSGNLLTSINNAIKQLVSPGTNAVVSVQAPLTASGTTDVSTALTTTSTPVVATDLSSSTPLYVNTNDSALMMFQNGDYPGATASLAGYIEEEMHS